MKFKLTLFFCIAVAAIAGGFLGELAAKSRSPYVSWLGYSAAFGFDTLHFNLHILQFDFGLHVNINVTQLLLVALALVVSPKIASAIKTS